ncbi:hypothetical protein OQA88_6941 [Cercophora sp. LCS_1]
MWFVDTTTLELAGPFFGKLPPFAILSHTWGNDELSLQDFKDYQQRQQHCHKNGLRKIQECCRLSKSNGYKYAWIDTVCIDKTSSAELTEAINSMYDWYAKSAICYAYLEDLQSEKEAATFLSDLKRCRWFTRGWTLQELIAPEKVIFFNKSWNMVGDKNRLSHDLGDITGICCPALLGNPIRLFSIADRMSWASSELVMNDTHTRTHTQNPVVGLEGRPMGRPSSDRREACGRRR